MGDQKNFYDKQELKSIRIEEILKAYGIEVKKNGFFSLRNEKGPSCKIYKSTNTYCDFGTHTGGDGINLVQHLENCEKIDAIEKLAQLFGVQPQNINAQQVKIELTDNQYELIGIAGDMATKNMKFDLDKYSFDTNKRRADKYRMPMNALKEKYLYMYEAILKTCALPYIQAYATEYQNEMKKDYTFRNLFKVVENLPISYLPDANEISEKFKLAAETFNRMEKVMEIACRDCNTMRFKATFHNPVKEYQKMATQTSLEGINQILEENPLWLAALEPEILNITARPKAHNDMEIQQEIASRIAVNINKEKADALQNDLERER